jgi:hypothetical protein
MDTFGPDFAELVDAEAPPVAMQAIPVAVPGAVRTQELASTYGGLATLSAVGYQTAVRVLTADPRRRNATVLALSQNIRFGRTQAQANLAGAVWLSQVPLVVHARDELWVSCATSGQSTDVSLVVERWS